jgi:hypothetical protein
MGKIRTSGLSSRYESDKASKHGHCSVSFKRNSSNYLHLLQFENGKRARKRLRLVSTYAVLLLAVILFDSTREIDAAAQSSPSNEGIFISPSTLVPIQNADDDDGGRSSTKNCTRPSSADFPPDLFSKKTRLHGALAIHFLVSIYLFYALLLICDDYFVPSVESICRGMESTGVTTTTVISKTEGIFINFSFS